MDNFIERSVILTHGSVLKVRVAELVNNRRNTPQAGTREANERREILRVLKITSGRVAGPDGAAAGMDMKRTTLISRIKKLGIEPRKVLSTLDHALFRTSGGLFLLPRTVDPRIAACHQSSTSVEIVFGISRRHPAPDLSLPLKSAI